MGHRSPDDFATVLQVLQSGASLIISHAFSSMSTKHIPDSTPQHLFKCQRCWLRVFWLKIVSIGEKVPMAFAGFMCPLNIIVSESSCTETALGY